MKTPLKQTTVLLTLFTLFLGSTNAWAAIGEPILGWPAETAWGCKFYFDEELRICQVKAMNTYCDNNDNECIMKRDLDYIDCISNNSDIYDACLIRVRNRISPRLNSNQNKN